MSIFGGGGLAGSVSKSLFGAGGGSGLNSLLQQMKRQQALRYTQAFANQYQGLDQITKGYDEALSNVGRTGLSSKLGIEAAGQQTQGKIAQSFTNRGLSNSTAMGAVQGMAGGQTAQALAGVDQAVSAAKAGLLTSKGNALNQAYGNLSQLNQSQLGSEMQLGGMAWQNLASQPSDYDQMLQLMNSIGGLLPLAFI